MSVSLVPGDWAARSACLDRPPMVDSKPGGVPGERNLAAKAICDGCEVVTECLSWVMSQPSEPCDGMIAGGLYSSERRRLRIGSKS